MRLVKTSGLSFQDVQGEYRISRITTRNIKIDFNQTPVIGKGKLIGIDRTDYDGVHANNARQLLDADVRQTISDPVL